MTVEFQVKSEALVKRTMLHLRLERQILVLHKILNFFLSITLTNDMSNSVQSLFWRHLWWNMFVLMVWTFCANKILYIYEYWAMSISCEMTVIFPNNWCDMILTYNHLGTFYFVLFVTLNFNFTKNISYDFNKVYSIKLYWKRTTP